MCIMVMRSHNFYLMNFLLIWYKDSFRVPDIILTKKSRGQSLFSHHGNQTIGFLGFLHFSDHNLKHTSQFILWQHTFLMLDILVALSQPQQGHLLTIFGIKMHKSCFQNNHVNHNFGKKLPNKFLFFFFFYFIKCRSDSTYRGVY